MTAPLVHLRGIHRTYQVEGGRPVTVLKGVDLDTAGQMVERPRSVDAGG